MNFYLSFVKLTGNPQLGQLSSVPPSPVSTILAEKFNSMGAVSLLPLLLPTSLRSYHFPSTQSLLSNFVASSQVVSLSPKCTKFRRKSIVFGKQSSNSNESQFLDENGVVDDMDGYLNYLSLEYDSVWDTKPSWCQPWTITLTGILVIACSWFIVRSIAVTAVILSLICLWWYIFLYSYPQAYSDMIAERRKKVTDGVEDTFGVKSGESGE